MLPWRRSMHGKRGRRRGAKRGQAPTLRPGAHASNSRQSSANSWRSRSGLDANVAARGRATAPPPEPITPQGRTTDPGPAARTASSWSRKTSLRVVACGAIALASKVSLRGSSAGVASTIRATSTGGRSPGTMSLTLYGRDAELWIADPPDLVFGRSSTPATTARPPPHRCRCDRRPRFDKGGSGRSRWSRTVPTGWSLFQRPCCPPYRWSSISRQFVSGDSSLIFRARPTWPAIRSTSCQLNFFLGARPV